MGSNDSSLDERYPEHAKQRKVISQMDAVQSFLDAMQERGLELGETVVTRVAVFEGTEECTAVQSVRGERLTRLVNEHFGIDRSKILAEKEQMIADMAAGSLR
jgi:hypothetical protein